MEIREKIVEFLEWKTTQLQECTDVKVFVALEDAQDIYDLTDNQVDKVLERFDNFIQGIDHHDGAICPWCALYVDTCENGVEGEKCSYGERHGDCNIDGSKYQDILFDLKGFAGDGFIKAIGILNIQDKLLSLFHNEEKN